nr:MFS transporter [Nocardioides luti]
MTPTRPDRADSRLLAPAYAATTIGTFSLIAFVAFEAMAVTTVMPSVAAELDGVALYALSFAAPLASGVVGMVAAGLWSDRRGPALPLVVALALFSLGLLVCGTAPSMEVLVAGRVLQGLGGGALTVGLYVVVGLVFPARLQPAVFASFAAAWVLPALFGPGLAAVVADAFGWRWVFLGTVALVVVAGLLIAPALRSLRERHAADAIAADGADATTATDGAGPSQLNRLVWAVVGAGAVLALELLGSSTGAAALLAALAFVLVVLALRRLLPPGTLVGRRGLPAVIGTRGLMSAGFFCVEAYIVFVLQERWGLTPGHAGLALTFVGITWAAASQTQARLGARVSHATAMRLGTALVVLGSVGVVVVVWTHAHPALAAAAYVLGGAGMGFGYPRTSVAMLDASTDRDRGANSSALTIADSLGAALALSVSGVVFAAAPRVGLDPFLSVLVLAVAIGALGTVTAARTRVVS